MKIEIWSDYVCPFCYIGKRRLEAALEQFAHREEVSIEYKSFELNPQAQFYLGKNMHQLLSEKHGMSLDEAKRRHAELGQQAAKLGLVYNFDQMKPTNSYNQRYRKSIEENSDERPQAGFRTNLENFYTKPVFCTNVYKSV